MLKISKNLSTNASDIDKYGYLNLAKIKKKFKKCPKKLLEEFSSFEQTVTPLQLIREAPESNHVIKFNPKNQLLHKNNIITFKI